MVFAQPPASLRCGDGTTAAAFRIPDRATLITPAATRKNQMTTSADQPDGTQGSGPREPLAMAQAALAALNATAASWDAKEPHDLHPQDTERFLRGASPCAQVAIADRLAALTQAVRAL